MATVACQGCGLPRAVSEIGIKECPVCAATPAVTATAPRHAKPVRPDPTDGLPADASELGTRPADPRSLALVVGAVMFFFGALVGVGGVIAFQSFGTDKPKPGNSIEVARKLDEPNPQSPAPIAPANLPKPREPEMAPLPHEPGTKLVEPVPEPELQPVVPPPPPGRITTIEVNQPDATYSLPFTMKKGEHVVLKGKVKVLRVPGLDTGAVLDASGLEAATITVATKIDGHSTLKLNAPNGTVHVTGKVDNKSVVEINAPGGEVKFMLTTTGTREGSKIDNGSTVAITGRLVEFKGDITGTDTKVGVTLTRNAWLKVASVNGTAKVEYKSQAAGWSPPDVTVGSVAPTAIFRKAGE